MCESKDEILPWLWIYIQGRVLLIIPEILVDYPSQLNLQTKMTYLDEVCNSKHNGYQTDAGVKIKGTLKIGYGFLCQPFSICKNRSLRAF